MDPFSRYLPALEEQLREAVAHRPGAPRLLYGMLAYHLGWVDDTFRPEESERGKRLRPIFLLLSCEAQGGDWQQALPAAAAVELLHNFSLIHDDIEDHDSTRRGRSTLWTLWGEAQAINAGDALFAVAFKTLTRLQETGVAPEVVLDAQRRYLEMALALTEGQCRDLAFETLDEISEEDYLRMVEGKTAALLGVCCELGGLIAGASPEGVAALRAFGLNLGLSFQMQDDLLGLWGDPEVTGKAVGADLRQHKKTLPILHGLSQSQQLRHLLSHPVLDEERVLAAQNLLEKVGSRRYTEARAETYHVRAMEALEQTGGEGVAQETLRQLAERLLRREK
ncbi:MAG: polyprenyl synthetase family protein [Anaerolineales bacterium]